MMWLRCFWPQICFQNALHVFAIDFLLVCRFLFGCEELKKRNNFGISPLTHSNSNFFEEKIFFSGHSYFMKIIENECDYDLCVPYLFGMFSANILIKCLTDPVTCDES